MDNERWLGRHGWYFPGFSLVDADPTMDELGNLEVEKKTLPESS